MSIHDHHMVMKNRVGVAELKAKLSDYLRRVKSGRSVTIMDRQTPIAKLVPFEPAPAPLPIRPATSRLRDVALPKPSEIPEAVSEALLKEERRDER